MGWRNGVSTLKHVLKPFSNPEGVKWYAIPICGLVCLFFMFDMFSLRGVARGPEISFSPPVGKPLGFASGYI